MFKSCLGVLQLPNQIPLSGHVFSLYPRLLLPATHRDHGNSRNTGSYRLHSTSTDRCQVFWCGITALQSRSYMDHAHSRKRRNALKRLKNKPHYDRLGLKPTASMGEIKSAYYELSKKYHPDVNASKDAKTSYSRIATAYETLKDPENRLEQEEEDIETESPAKERYQRRGRHSSKKPVKFGPEYSERFDPRWPLNEEWVYSEKHNTMFRKARDTTVNSSSRRIKIHDTIRRDEDYFFYPPPTRPKPRQPPCDTPNSSSSYVFVVCILTFLLVLEHTNI